MPIKDPHNRIEDPREQEIEVTEAMKAAGVNAFIYDPEYGGLEEALETVYQVMELARRDAA